MSDQWDEKVELKLRNIVDSGRPKTITINGKRYYISKDKIINARNEEKKVGGILPLIPLIIGGLAAAGSVAGGAAGIAQAVNKKKAEDAALAEQKRHNISLENAARGQGLEEVGKKIDSAVLTSKQAIKNFVSKIPTVGDEGRKVLKRTLYHLADAIDVRKEGEGLYLGPYREGNGMFLAPSQ